MSQRSVRRRFYATGSAIALLLDRLAEQTWKARLLEKNLNLQETLADVIGYDGTGEPGAALQGMARMRTEAERAVSRLRNTRVAQADSITRGPGVRLSVDPGPLGQGVLQWCGFDPQNTLQTGDGRTLHMRFLQVCAGNRVKGELNQPVVQHDSTGIISLAVEAGSLKLTAGGRPLVVVEGQASEVEGQASDVMELVVETERMRLEAKRARVTRRGDALSVLLLNVES